MDNVGGGVILKSRWQAFSSLLLILISLPAMAARFPNSFPKTYTVEGATAVEWVKLLGLDPSREYQLKLQLHPMEAHAQALAEGKDTNEGPAFNQIRYDPKLQKLTLSGTWLDQMTGSNQEKQPRFTFSSGVMGEDLSNAGAWTELLRGQNLAKKEDSAKKQGETLVMKSSTPKQFPSLQLKVYQMQTWDKDPKGTWGYLVEIGVDEAAVQKSIFDHLSPSKDKSLD